MKKLILLQQTYFKRNKTPLKEAVVSSRLRGILTNVSYLKMQNIRNSILGHVRLRISSEELFMQKKNLFKHLLCQMSTSTGTSQSPDQVMDRVIRLVKKFDRVDASKVTETADFRKDLSLDSLDRVELVMAFEQEFSIEIPDEKADKLTCCADVAKYVVSESDTISS